MSVESVLEFWQAAHEDTDLRDAVAGGIEGKDDEEALEAIAEIARGAGYEFSNEEYADARLELPKLVLAGDDAEEGEVSGFASLGISTRLLQTGGALQPGGILRRGGLLNGSLGSTSSLYTKYRGY